jgi:hypothetical protein
MANSTVAMSNDSITTVLQMVAWGTRLSFGLYDFSACVSSASGDVNSLAKEVNLLALVLRQVGANLKADGKIPSEEAFDIVSQILMQCRDVFGEIEAIVPVRQLQDAQGLGVGGVDDAVVGRLRDGLEWNVLSRAKTHYLLAHLESLKLTMSVMLQTMYTAKISVWGRYVPHASLLSKAYSDNLHRYQTSQIAGDAVLTERLQLETLIIEQQLCLLRAYRLYDEYKQRVKNTPLLLTQSPQSQALVHRDQYGPSPGALVLYQEPSLARTPPSANESQDLGRIRRISSPYVDNLLARWVRLPDIDEHMRKLYLSNSNGGSQQSERGERRNSNWQQPLVESDDESDGEYSGSRRRPKLHVSTPGPLLMPMNCDDHSHTASPIPVPGVLRPTGPPYSPAPISNSWAPSSNTGNYFPTRNGNLSAGDSPQTPYRARRSPAPSPLSSPRTSFSSDGQTLRPVTAFKPQENGQKPPPQQQQQQQLQRLPIPWRLRLKHTYWDFNDNNLIGSNTPLAPSTCHHDRSTVTEIMSQFVSRAALRERDHAYERVKKDTGDRHHTQLESCYCIEGALTFNEVVRLVDLTTRIRYPPPQPNAARGSRVPLDRSYTAPSGAPRAGGGAAWHSHSDSDSGSKRGEGRRKDGGSSSSGKDKSRSRRDSSVRRDRERDGDGRKKTATLTKLAMGGAGMLTLLDGLPEMLSYVV